MKGLAAAIATTSLMACSTTDTSSPAPDASTAQPPVARVQSRTLETHGHQRVDDYYWLRERDDPEVIGYLEAENEYLESVTAPWSTLRKSLLEEMLGRIERDDSTVPLRVRSYLYYQRFEGDAEYALHCRRADSAAAAGPQARETILLDGPAMAEGHGYFRIGATAISSDERTLAYAVDTVGRRIYTLRFKDIATDAALDDVIEAVTPNFTWAEDGKTLFYTRQDPQTLRYHRIFRHTLGTDPADDVLVYEETDPEFTAFVTKTTSRRFLVIHSSQTLSTEARVVDATRPFDTFRVLEPRRPDHEYSIDHLGDRFYIRTNWEALNFRLMSAPGSATSRDSWREELPHRDDVLLSGAALFDDHLVVQERRDGLVRLRVRPWSSDAWHEMEFGDPAYSAGLGSNPEPSSTVVRYHYSSLTTPPSVFDYDMATGERTLRKVRQVPGGFDAADYTSERLWAEARDGTRVPISLVYRSDARREGGNPLLLYGYGSYGSSIDASFGSDRLSLLDRGFVFAMAHVRGGQELGRAWYEEGKLQHKRNSFTDFIDSAEHLIAARYADPERIFAVGGSAGGLLVGAALTMRPDLWTGVVAHVPFVDVVTTMLDDTIPLTSNEWDEWGDPREQDDYEYMLSYSPYDKVVARDYPHLLVTTGLQDSQVQYWEPAKWVAKLRALKTDDRLLLLRTEMQAGHGGASGRFRAREETALTYAFLLTLAGAD
ncbi:MAG: S9 family peptidase [Acidobacteriota bacterium]|nr:S9 family peptidase [Acidobacteriota bacterium]